MQRKNMWKEYTEIQQKELEELSVRYKECLDIGKTAVSYTHLTLPTNSLV